MASRFVGICLGITISFGSFAQNASPTLCETGEKALFSCGVGKKTVSICASSDLTARTGYLQYRFGPSRDRLEMVYPKVKQHPARLFSLSADGGAKASSEQLSFSNGDYHYVVFVERAVFDWNGQGIVVHKAGKLIAHLPCSGRPDPDDMWNLTHVGIPVIESQDWDIPRQF
jgi:hypothetical protein